MQATAGMKATKGPTTQYGCHQKHGGRPTAWREANNSRDNRNITESTAEGRPATARKPEIVEITNNSTSISRDANSTIWTSTTHLRFHGNSPKSRQIGEKFVKKDEKRSKNSQFFCPIYLSNSDRYRTIGSPMYLVR
jgi:hypothetical protein